MRRFGWLWIAFSVAFPAALHAASVYTQRPDDKAAIYLTKSNFNVQGDGVADDSAALQQAIDRVQEAPRSGGQGILFIPEGRYRITRTIYVWPGIRIIGYGVHRPVIALGAHTPGYQAGVGYMMLFAGSRGARAPRHGRPAHAAEPFEGTVPLASGVDDANPGTFYSAMSNVDFEMGEGNPAAVGIRIHAAQHCFLTHMDFRIASGLAGLKDIGNEAEDLHFFGGRFGIITSKPSPGWQFTLLDSTFEGQREAAIAEHEAGLTLVRDQFRNVPSAIVIDPGYAEELWVQQSRFENITGPAIIISNERNERTEISVEGLECSHVPTLARFRESGREIVGPSEIFEVKEFSHGLKVVAGIAAAKIETVFKALPLTVLSTFSPPAIRALPDSKKWVNLLTFGAKGDGVSDDTAAIEAAIHEHDIIYLPMGRYRVSRTIRLRPETVLIGLHPSLTQIDLADRTPGFDGAGGPVALLETPSGGKNIVSGIGLFTGGINNRAAAVMWHAGKDSLMDDVRLLGGHGTNNADGTRVDPYNENHTADPDPQRRWDAQFPSLWVLDSGGGTFANIWTPDTYAQAGMYVSNTETEGHVYELSSEHHVRAEVKLDHVSNWELVGLQTEEEHGEGPAALPLEIDHGKNVLIANMHSYRVVGMMETFPYAVRVSHSEDLRFRNLHVDSDSKVSFNTSVFDVDSGASVRFRELESLTITGRSRATPNTLASAPPISPVTLLTGGFFNISGAVADRDGRLYFVDARWQKIYRWSKEQGIETVLDSPLDAANLAIDRAGDLMLISYAGEGTVYSFNPNSAKNGFTVLSPQPTMPRPGLDVYLPIDRWNLPAGILKLQHEFQYISPDGSTFIPAGADFVHGELYYGTKMSDVLRTFALARATPGKSFYVTNEEEHKTYVGQVDSTGALTGLKLFAERGGESVTVGADGRVYIAAGQVYVYSPLGEELETIEIPERPIDVVFGGKQGRTLFILARTSLYSTER